MQGVCYIKENYTTKILHFQSFQLQRRQYLPAEPLHWAQGEQFQWQHQPWLVEREEPLALQPATLQTLLVVREGSVVLPTY